MFLFPIISEFLNNIIVLWTVTPYPLKDEYQIFR